MNETASGKSRFSAEMLVGVSAVFIGVLALGVSLYETSLMRWEQRAAVLPLLELSRSYFSSSQDEPSQEKWRLSLNAQNVGIGPARIQDFTVKVDGIAQPTWGDAFEALLGRDIEITYGQSTINGRTIPPDRQVTMFELRDTQLTAEIIEEFDRLEFSACFCSIFEECWITSYATFGAAQSIQSCAVSEESFRE